MRIPKLFLLGYMLFACTNARAQSKTLLVPAQFSTIQAALDNASTLAVDTVLVSPGTYIEAVNFKGKNARLVSANGPSVTFIEAPPGSTALSFSSGETAAALVSGFTITNSNSGVGVSFSAPTI